MAAGHDIEIIIRCLQIHVGDKHTYLWLGEDICKKPSKWDSLSGENFGLISQK